MADVTEITLGDRKFGIRRLTIGQLIELQALQMVGTKMGQETDANEPADVFLRRLGMRMLDTIAAALSRDFPEMTREFISQMEMSNEDLRTAYTAVLTHAGLLQGEATGNP